MVAMKEITTLKNKPHPPNSYIVKPKHTNATRKSKELIKSNKLNGLKSAESHRTQGGEEFE